MIDIKILSIQDLLPVNGLSYATGITPVSLVITGSSYLGATSVYVNDLQVSEFIIVSDNKIIAQLPSGAVGSVIRKVAVIAEKPTVNRASLLQFDLGSSFSLLQGIERLVQIFCKILIQTPGSDKFYPSLGGGLLTVVGSNVSRSDVKGMQASVVSAVSKTRDQILGIQSKNKSIPSDERLLSADASGVGFDVLTTTLSARIALSAVSGKAAVANLTF